MKSLNNITLNDNYSTTSLQLTSPYLTDWDKSLLLNAEEEVGINDATKKYLLECSINSNKHARVENLSKLLTSEHGFEVYKSCNFSNHDIWELDAAIQLTFSELEETIVILKRESQNHGCRCTGWGFIVDDEIEDKLDLILENAPIGRIISINDVEHTEPDDEAIIALPEEIADCNPSHFSNFRQVVVPFGGSFCTGHILLALGEHITAGFSSNGSSEITAHLIITDPNDIENSGKHEGYQRALHSVIINRKGIKIPEGFTIEIPADDETEMDEFFLGEGHKVNPIRNCQLFVKVTAKKYHLVFQKLNALMEELDKEARSKMK